MSQNISVKIFLDNHDAVYYNEKYRFFRRGSDESVAYGSLHLAVA